jgi:pilus assembly protein CpaF
MTSDPKDNVKTSLRDLLTTRGQSAQSNSKMIEYKSGEGQGSSIRPLDKSKSEVRTNSGELPKNPTARKSSDNIAAIKSASDRSSKSNRQMSDTSHKIMLEARKELVSKKDANRLEDGILTIAETAITEAVEKVVSIGAYEIDDLEQAHIIVALQRDLMGWGVLQPLIDNAEVTDIHVYDFETVVLQRGKVSEITGLHWPNKQSYNVFLDRLLMRLGKSLSTQQHTVDASFPDGTRICAVHDSVCGQRGPLLCIRVPRIKEVSLDNLISYQVAPPFIVHYLASLIRSAEVTMMVAGETGTGKTTLIKCLGTQFGPDESIIAVEDTPELNFQHPYFRSLVSRPPNIEGAGEVTLQEHIKTTLRMTPTRVILGEMRTPFAAEAFLESAQTGHVGMSTVHARNAKETLTRLESLLGRAQKSVSIDIIRQQIALAVDCVIWLFREKGTGKPRIGEIIEVGHFVEGVIQIRPMFSYVHGRGKPVWRVDSWASGFSEYLEKDGVYLNEAPSELTFSNVSSGLRG